MSQSGYTLRVWRKPSPSRVERLRRHVDTLDRRYRVGRPVVSDGEFDALAAHLEHMERSMFLGEVGHASPLNRIGPTTSRLNAEHPSPVYSLDKARSMDELRAWHRSVTNILGHKPGCTLEFKLDGCCVNLVYRDGKLAVAISQGDGKRGMNVTHVLRQVPEGLGHLDAFLSLCKPPVPGELHGVDKGVLEVRGEVVMPMAEWEALNERRTREKEPLYDSPCSAVSATLQLLDPPEIARRVRHLRFVAHGFGRADGMADGWGTMGDFKSAMAWYSFKTPTGVPADLGTVLYMADFTRPTSDTLGGEKIPTDGLVIKVASLDDQAKLGCTHRAPRWAVACKGWR